MTGLPGIEVPRRAGVEERLAAMVRIETVTAPDDTAAFAEFPKLLAELYPLVHSRLESRTVVERGILLRWPAASTEQREAVVLMAHWDVVPAVEADGWSTPPFAGTIADGTVWGRGTLDDKGQLCVLLEAVENLLAAGVTPKRDIYLCLGGNEESYGDANRAIAADFQARAVMPWLVLDEGGAVVDAPMPQVPVPAAMVGVAEKGVATIELRAVGKGGHASAPGKELATTRIARAIGRLQRHPFRPQLSETGREMFEELSKHASGRARTLARVIARNPRLAARILASQGGEAAALVRTTVAVTMLSGGTAANVLPNGASATLNVRLAPSDTVASALEHIERVIDDPEVEIVLHEGDEPTAQSPRDGAQFELIRAAVDTAYPGIPTVPYVQMSATDSRHFHRFAPAVYRFAPLEMDAAQRASIHGVDERVSVATLDRGVLFYQALITGIPGPDMPHD